MERSIINLYKKIWILSTLLLITSISAYSAPKRIMPLGDSITYGYPSSTGYRNYLWYKLRDAHYTVNFVGSQHDGYGYGFDVDHEGYGGWKTYDIAGIVYSLLQDNPPDIILLHIGSNDVSPTQGLNSSSVSGLNDILNEIDNYERNYHHPIRVILATIINRRDYHKTVRDYNRNLINLAHSRIANGDKITLVDMEYGAGLNKSNYADATHPNNDGYAKMAKIWFRTLDTLLPPPIPENLNIFNITHQSAQLSWKDVSDKEDGYKIYENNTLIAIIGKNNTTYTLNNLASETTYRYKVVAYNNNGDSETDEITMTTLAIPIPPKPTSFTTSSIGTTVATLSWHDNSNNESGFKIYQNNTLIATVPANTTHYQIKGLKSRETYSFTIKAYNANGVSAPITLTLKTKDDYGWIIPIHYIILD